jgi:hypothetical protein
MAKRKPARKPNNASRAVTLRLTRPEMQVLRRVAQLAGVPLSTVCAVILAQGVLIELGKLRAAKKRP